MEAPAYKNRMKRLDDIDKSINRLINAVASKERDAIDKTMRKVYESSYHHAVYEVARMSGLDLQTGPIDEGALETILKRNGQVRTIPKEYGTILRRSLMR